MNINEVMKQLAEYIRLSDELNATIDSLKDDIKKYMIDNNMDVLNGKEHKASYKSVTSSRIDTTAIKKELPDIAAKYTKTIESKRFTFV